MTEPQTQPTLPAQTPTAPTFIPMTEVELIDLRRRVLAKEAVTDEELKRALETTANIRASAPGRKADAGAPQVSNAVANSVAARLAAMKAKATGG